MRKLSLLRFKYIIIVILDKIKLASNTFPWGQISGLFLKGLIHVVKISANIHQPTQCILLIISLPRQHKQYNKAKQPLPPLPDKGIQPYWPESRYANCSMYTADWMNEVVVCKISLGNCRVLTMGWDSASQYFSRYNIHFQISRQGWWNIYGRKENHVKNVHINWDRFVHQ